MWQGLCIAWIVGIALMGIDIPFFQYTGWYIAFAGLLILISVVLVKSSVYRVLILQLALFPIGLSAGHYYAEQALAERIQFREMTSRTTEIIVYVRHLNQLSTASIQQKAQVLSDNQQNIPISQRPIYWTLSMARPKQLPSHELVYQDLKDEVAEVEASTTKKSHSSLPILQLGQYYRLTGQVRPQHSYATAGAFDSEKWQLQHDVMANFRVRQVERLSEQHIQALGLGEHVVQHQRWYAQIALQVEHFRLTIRQYLQSKPLQHKGLILALLTGDKSLLDHETEQQFMRLGISHLLAISGPHVLILAILMTWLSHRVIIHFYPEIYLRIARPYLLCFPFVGCVVFYTAFVGFEIPAMRTLLMTCLMSALLLFNRRLQTANIVILSASILLLIEPLSVLSASFWLSYGASFILLRIYQTVGQERQVSDPPVPATAWQTASVAVRALIESQWKIFIALFPLVMIFFQKVSLLAPLVNIVAIPFLSVLVVPVNIVASAIYAVIPSLGYVLWWLTNHSLDVFTGILSMFEAVAQLDLLAIAMQPWAIVCLIIAVIIFFLPANVLPKSWLWVCIPALLLANSQKKSFELHVLDVGQGQSIFIQSERYTALIDTGGHYDEQRFSIGQNVVVPFLLKHGVSRLDEVILSHLDNDHSGALPAILKDISVQRIVANEDFRADEFMQRLTEYRPQHQLRQQFQRCQVGQQWQPSSAFKIRVLSPQAGLSDEQIRQNRNEYSCVLYVEVQGNESADYRTFLIMGDAGWDTEKQILQQFPTLPVDVLIVGHHGSKHSSLEAFVAHYRPKLAIASAGFANRYQHPHQEVVDIFKKYEIPFISTIENGTLRFRLMEGQMELSAYRQQRTWLRREQTWQSSTLQGDNGALIK